MLYTKAWAIERFNSEGSLKCRLFWGHRPRKDGRVGSQCMSQWFDSPFDVDGVSYSIAEHWMMAEKARIFGDEHALELILNSRDPGKAKAVGRSVRSFHAQKWDEAKFDIVVEGNVHKFASDKRLRDYLFQTGELLLVEASPVDLIWGTGLPADHADAENPNAWRGQNLLGFALMEARDRLRVRG